MSSSGKGDSEKPLSSIVRATGQRVAKAARATATGARTAARAAGRGAKASAEAVATAGVATARTVAKKTLDLREKELAKARPAAVAVVARLRKSKPTATPAEIVASLEASFTKDNKATTPQSELFLKSAVTYVVGLDEIYGTKVRDPKIRDGLISFVLAANSDAARAVAEVGALVLPFAPSRVQGIVSAAKTAQKTIRRNAGKLSILAPLAKLAGVSNAGRMGGAALVVAASRRAFGDPPAKWPTATKTAKTTSTTRAATKKTATKSP